MRKEFTVTGIINFGHGFSFDEVRLIAESFMDCAADLMDDGSDDIVIAADLENRVIEIECVTDGEDYTDGLANGRIAISRVCECAAIPVTFKDDRRPCPQSFQVTADDSEVLQRA